MELLGKDVQEESRAFFGEMKIDVKKHDADVDSYVGSLIRPNLALISHATTDLTQKLREAKAFAAEVRDGNPRHQRPGDKEEYAWVTAYSLGSMLAIAEHRTREIIYLRTGKAPARSPKK
jgi:hypothetical protein